MPDDLADIPKVPAPAYEKHPPRKPLTREQILRIVVRQIGPDGILKCGCGCGTPLDPCCIDEHLTPRETLPYPQCDDLSNRALFNVECAKTKTVADQGVIGHWRRVRGDSGQKKRRKERGGSSIKSNPKIVSPGFQSGRGMGGRGFDKTKTRGFDGKVRERI